MSLLGVLKGMSEGTSRVVNSPNRPSALLSNRPSALLRENKLADRLGERTGKV